MACLETKLQQLLAASFLLTGAAVLIRQNRNVPTDLDEYTSNLVQEDIDGTPGEPRKAHTEWWTAHPPAGRRRGSDLPQCCGSLEKGGDGKWCAKRTDGFEVPSYVGPAPANFRFEPEQLKEALRGRRVVLMGDSLTLQWSKMLGCYLTGDDHRNEYSKADAPLWNATREKIQRLREKPYPLPNDDRTFAFYRLPLGGPGDGEIVTYVTHGFWPSIAEGFLALHARYPEERADLVIINQGAHFNNPSLNHGPSSLYEDLVGYMELCRAEGLRCVLRESSAQHFWYNDTKLQSGLYKSGKQRQCISSRYNESERALFYDSLAEWRRDDLTAALEHVGQPERVMRIFDATVPLTYAHPLQGDCTHYALDTEYWEPWHAALFGLVEELPTANRHAALFGLVEELPTKHPDDLDPWTYHLEDTRLPMLTHPQGDESCKHFRAGEEESGTVPEWLRWHFAPPRSSEWLQFNASQLCSALSAKAANHSNPRMLFVGDSMSQAQFESLLFLLGDAEKFDLSAMAPVKGRDPHVSKQDFAPAETRRDHGSKNGGALACGGKLWIQQQGTMNSYVDYSTDFEIPNHTDWVQSFDVVVVMLPWSTEDWRTQKGIDFWLSSLLPHQQLIIRPATIGHEHTGALYNHSWRDDDVDAVFAKRPHRSPLKTPAEVVKYFGSMMGHISWQKHRENHERILADVRQNHTGVSILDVFYLTSMMWDRHRDPLHYCHPGPMNTWNEILFNLLVRGHLRDYDEWESAFSKEVVRLGGLRNSAGVPFEQ